MIRNNKQSQLFLVNIYKISIDIFLKAAENYTKSNNDLVKNKIQLKHIKLFEKVVEDTQERNMLSFFS